MSTIHFMEKLLDGVEVEWRLLGKVSAVLRGKRLTKSQLSTSEKFPVFHGGLEPLGHYAESNRPSNTVMIINVGASAGTVGYSHKEFWSSDGCFCLMHNDKINNKFLYYMLIGFQNLLRSRVRIAGIPTLDASVVERLEIPLPCPSNPKKSLEIQAEIVRILDAFSAVTAELAAELAARKKQYNYYRDQLLSFKEGDVEWKTLGEICTSISAGGDLPEDYIKGQTVPTDEFKYPIYSNGTGDKSLYGFTNSYKIERDAVTISARGTIGYHTVRIGKFTPIVRLISLVPNNDIILTKFLNYILDITPIGGTGGSIPQLTVPTVQKITIPIPSLKEQARLVALLDKFDTLTNSITEGLPREIELRQKQYEYYRNLLFTFPPTKQLNN